MINMLRALKNRQHGKHMGNGIRVNAILRNNQKEILTIKNTSFCDTFDEPIST